MRMLIIAVMMTFASTAYGQQRARAPLTGNPIADIKTAVTGKVVDNAVDKDLLGALEVQLLPDLKYALNLATKSNNKVTGPCYAAWIAIIEARQSANVDDQGNTMTPPDPGLITKFEKIVELRNALQPESDFMVKCSPVASMVKSDIRKFIGLVLSGGAGLAALGIGL